MIINVTLPSTTIDIQVLGHRGNPVDRENIIWSAHTQNPHLDAAIHTDPIWTCTVLDHLEDVINDYLRAEEETRQGHLEAQEQADVP